MSEETLPALPTAPPLLINEQALNYLVEAGLNDPHEMARRARLALQTLENQLEAMKYVSTKGGLKPVPDNAERRQAAKLILQIQHKVVGVDQGPSTSIHGHKEVHVHFNSNT